MLKTLNWEQLQIAIDENPTRSTRELSKIFNVSRHLTIRGEQRSLGWESLKGWQMDSARIVRNQEVTAYNLLCFTALDLQDASEQQTAEPSAASAETHPPSFHPLRKPYSYPDALHSMIGGIIHHEAITRVAISYGGIISEAKLTIQSN
ncbi:unnamed protein product [Hymenolepis diminuta]|uniref:Uncharacterized protein n=1 Tax=Hymenolepis diminuta TaxID=6216 RepID=A0A564YZD9_HYMDI|nr:unnamed protein product [Hymenolepis diminuta]